MVLLSQLSIDALNNATLQTVALPSLLRTDACILLHPLLDLGQCTYIEGRWTHQSN